MESSRERSPNYPTVSLEGAVNLVSRLYEAEKRAAIPLVVVAQALSGNERLEKLSGPARSKIAVLRAFGLIEDVPPGKVRVSARALGILQQPTPATFHTALREAALAPPLFAELFEEHQDDSDGALKYYLMTERKFTEDGANRAVRTYRETLAFANQALGSYPRNTQPVIEAPDSEENPFQHKGESVDRGIQQVKAGKDNSSGKVLHMAYTWPLPDGVDAQVSILGNKPTVRAIQRLITYLEYMRDDLKENAAAQGAQDEPATDA
jgi:hypothetical protein